MIFLTYFLIYWLICSIVMILKIKSIDWEKAEEKLVNESAELNAIGQIPPPLMTASLAIIVILSFITVPYVYLNKIYSYFNK